MLRAEQTKELFLSKALGFGFDYSHKWFPLVAYLKFPLKLKLHSYHLQRKTSCTLISSNAVVLSPTSIALVFATALLPTNLSP